eukprot:GHVH01000915.1.p1 GENE.GHVH01000915.1~~GHVH01000915.1.p1  ORF type:complete len:113 (+),score=24.26 GHVH01000915.1:36-374(+)
MGNTIKSGPLNCCYHSEPDSKTQKVEDIHDLFMDEHHKELVKTINNLQVAEGAKEFTMNGEQIENLIAENNEKVKTREKAEVDEKLRIDKEKSIAFQVAEAALRRQAMMETQ